MNDSHCVACPAGSSFLFLVCSLGLIHRSYMQVPGRPARRAPTATVCPGPIKTHPAAAQGAVWYARPEATARVG